MPPEKIEAFWEWFQQEEVQGLIYDHRQPNTPIEIVNLNHPTYRKLHRKLDDMNISYQFGMQDPSDDNKCEFVIHGCGIKRAFPIVKAMVRAAPTLPRWNVVAFKPRQEELFSILFEGRFNADPEKMQCITNIEHENPRKIYVFVFFDVPYRLYYSSRQKYQQLTYLMLDAALGEYNVEMHLGRIETCHVSDLKYDTENEVRPFLEFPKLFDEMMAMPKEEQNRT